MTTPSNVTRSPLYAAWETKVAEALAKLIGCDYGDAQAIMAARPDVLATSWTLRETADVAAAAIDASSKASPAPAPPWTMRQFVDQVKVLLRSQPLGTRLQDGDTGGYFFLDGEAVFACQLDGDRDADAVDLDESAWDFARGCWEDSTPEVTMATVLSPVLLPPNDGRPEHPAPASAP
ncbi:hypothetical protein [uncultured Variovorax sp.]|uniref:hypothetical protein n=1 Tax=uncultured Variovorax sp. TaxID=114708 RepID=UPI0026148C74|nr:hypothetical protein [uncultured Variovorax sp.]